MELLKDYLRGKWWLVISILVNVMSIGGSIYYVYMNECEICEICTDISVESREEDIIRVDVKGAVKRPNVYVFSSNSTVKDAIDAAGGITSKGTTKNINLSKKLKDEMVIYVFEKTDLEQKVSSLDKTEETLQNQVIIEAPECVCETIEIKECINEKEDINVEIDKPIIEDIGEDNGNSKDKVSINKGTIEELITLDGIGESKAKAIIEYREKNGKFKTIEDIKSVSGIGDAAFNKIKDKIIV